MAAAAVLFTVYAFYLWNKPHRNVQNVKAFASVTAEGLVKEFSDDPAAANQKYLSSDGNSKVLIVTGRISSISMNQKQEKMVLLKEEDHPVGVMCTFAAATNAHTEGMKPGDIIHVKGAITSGSSYDKDLDLYEHALLVQCDVAK